ncbi:MAG: FAD-binding protein, partial [Raoultibacter sp.]
MSGLSRRQFITGGAVAALGGTLALTGCASPSGNASATPKGEGASTSAVGSGMGKHGTFTIEVTVTDGKIDRIIALDSRETPGMGDVAIEKISNAIVENQTLNVDTVSGATLTSIAFIGAVSDALDQIGEKSSEWKKRDKAPYTFETTLPQTADVVVIGGGGAGFAAAITAANEGKNVILMEKMGVYGGDTALSGGEMAAPGNWIQVQEGIADSPADLAKDMLIGGDEKGDPELVQVIAEGALDSSEWLTFEAGVSWKHDLMQFGGHTIKRSIIPITHSGSEMTSKLTKRAQEIKTLTIIDNTKATELVTDSAGAITGVKAQNTVSGDEATVACKAIVMAAGGFGSNIDMRVKYNPEMDDSILSTDSVGATGDGIVMAEKIGANLIDMEYIQTYPVCDPENGALLYVGDMRLESRAIMINKEGVRF